MIPSSNPRITSFGLCPTCSLSLVNHFIPWVSLLSALDCSSVTRLTFKASLMMIKENIILSAKRAENQVSKKIAVVVAMIAAVWLENNPPLYITIFRENFFSLIVSIVILISLVSPQVMAMLSMSLIVMEGKVKGKRWKVEGRIDVWFKMHDAWWLSLVDFLFSVKFYSKLSSPSLNPVCMCEPSQKGLFLEFPHLQRVTRFLTS